MMPWRETADEVDSSEDQVEVELWDYKLRNHCLVSLLSCSCLRVVL